MQFVYIDLNMADRRIKRIVYFELTACVLEKYNAYVVKLYWYRIFCLIAALYNYDFYIFYINRCV